MEIKLCVIKIRQAVDMLKQLDQTARVWIPSNCYGIPSGYNEISDVVEMIRFLADMLEDQ